MCLLTISCPNKDHCPFHKLNCSIVSNYWQIFFLERVFQDQEHCPFHTCFVSMAPKATVQLSLIVEGSFSWSCISVYLYHPSFKPVLILDHMYIYRDWVEITVFLRILFENVRDLLKNYLLIAFILKHVHSQLNPSYPVFRVLSW